MLGRPGGPVCVPGMVYLVGGGPGDPSLLTCRAWTLLQSADLVLYDALVGEKVRDCIGPDAQRIHVGKRSGNHRARQAEIEALMIQHALAGKRVVRLKGGDSMVFGRGGEEMTALRAAGVPYEVVPGISAALASGALSGVPLTHRDLSGAFTVLTGHDAAQLNRSSEHWAAVAAADHTLVVLMGLRRLPDIVQRLTTGGRDPQTP
ncbi:MAG: uroporphyrin-III C-methyltransferase, partial [Cognaticolwellia sp.]